MATTTGTGALTTDRLARLALDRGLSNAAAVIATAIALAESGGRPEAVGDQGTSYGLWQIHYTVHPQFDPSRLFDPVYNATAMAQLSGNGKDWTPWSTFTNGAYRAYLGQAQAAVNAASGLTGGASSVLGGGVGTGILTDPYNSTTTPAPNNAMGSSGKGLQWKISVPWGTIDLSPFLWYGAIASGAMLMTTGVILLALGATRGIAGPATEAAQAVALPGKLARVARGGRRVASKPQAARLRPAAVKEPRAPRAAPRQVRVGDRYYREGSTSHKTAVLRRDQQARERQIIRRGSAAGASPRDRERAARLLAGGAR